MEIVRQQLGNGDSGEFRARQLRARQMLNGELEGSDLDAFVEERLMTTTMDKAANWARGNAFMPATFGLACCAIEMMAAVNARMDIARFGFEAFRASPRQADLMIISGRVSIKMAPVVRRIYDQMLEPKWAIAMGACSSSMGVFNNYAIVYGILKLRAMVMAKPDEGWRSRYGGRGTEEFTESELAIEAPSA
jgi:NADH-quinone oxidoreductase subunit B